MEVGWGIGKQEMNWFGRTEIYVREQNVCWGEKVHSNLIPSHSRQQKVSN